MQTTLARRQRRRRALGRRPAGRGGSTVRRIVIAIPIIVLLVGVLMAGAGLLFTTAAYNYYAQGLPDPKSLLADLDFEQQTVVYDRTGTVELARLGELRREVVGFDAIPAEMLDATTAIEDKDFWQNAGFDPIGIVSAGLDTISGRPRGASTITQQLVRNRLLPAAAFEGSTYERKIREIIQSIRLTEAFPGESGKQQIITAYLNNNFYGNQTYGVKAAAKGYFAKPMEELTLAQHAILAAIPQSPTKFDLMRNAEEVCLDDPEPADPADCETIQLQVPADTEIVQRRDYILDLMKTRSPLSGQKYTEADYDAAKAEPVILTPPPPVNWRAPHFVNQVRARARQAPLPRYARGLRRGRYRWLQGHHDPRLEDAEDHREVRQRRRPCAAVQGSARLSQVPQDPAARVELDPGPAWPEHPQRGLGRDGLPDRRSARLRRQRELDRQGHEEVPAAVRRPGPGLAAAGFRDQAGRLPHRHRGRDDDREHDVHGRHHELRQPVRPDPGGQAGTRPRPACAARSSSRSTSRPSRPRSSAASTTCSSGPRTSACAILGTAIPVTSMGIGTLEVHPIDLLGAYGTIANGGVRMPRQTIGTIVDADGKQVWPIDDVKPEGIEVTSKQAAYIVTDILAGNTNPQVNPFWADWAIYDDSGKRRPAAYKTGTTSDNVDVHAYGYLAKPKEKDLPALAVGVWMGNSNNDPNRGSLSLDSSAPLWSAILSDISKDLPIAKFKAPDGLKSATVDAFTGLKPGPYTTKTVKELFLPGTVPTQKESIRIGREIDEASGLLWQEGCVGPKVTRGFFNLSEVESNFPAWQKANQNWASRAAKGNGVRGTSKGTRTAYFYSGQFRPFGSSWGAPFAPREKCPLAPPPSPPPCDPLLVSFCPSEPPGGVVRPTDKPKPTKRP